MPTATKSPRSRPRQVIHLAEDISHSSQPHKVDKEKGIIFGVKVLGLDSANERRYTLEAARKALPLYEGVAVNIDHPAKPLEPRSAYDRFGQLRNPRIHEDGIYADLHLLKTHPMADRIMEAAEKMPDAFGLSHNAQGEGRQEGGVFVVESITEVRHVDLVADPATTKSLYESKQRPTMKVKQVLEQLKKSVKNPAYLKTLLEMDPAEMPLDADVSTSSEPSIDDAFEQMVCSVFKDTSLDAKSKIKKIGEIIKSQEKLMGLTAEQAKEEEEEEPEEKDEMKEGDEEEKKDKLESIVRELQTKEHCRELCEEMDVVPSKLQLKLLAKLDNDKERKEFLQEAKLAANRQKPKSKSPGQSITESLTAPKDYKEFAAAIRS